MFRSLHTRFALSHTLPILVFVPLLGLLLLYQLERRFFLDYLARDLADEGKVIAEFTQLIDQIWFDPAFARALQNDLQSRVPDASVEILNRDARLLASPFASDSNRIGDIIQSATIEQALKGQASWAVDATASGDERLIDVAVPVIDDNDQVIGIIRLFRRLTDIQDRLNELRWLVLITLATSGVITLAIGLLLARSLSIPLLRLQEFVTHFTPEKKPEALPENGPYEVAMLATAFNRMSSRLFDLERTRKLLLAGIVHELGRPLGSIRMAAQTITSSSDNATLTSELSQGIKTQVDALSLHLNDLALLGEMDIHTLQLDRHPTDLNELVTAQVQQFQSLASQKQQILSLEIDPALPILEVDARRIEQIVGNLLHNACKYTPEHGKITLTTRLEDQQALITVGDNGAGIAHGEEERIFEFFYRNPAQRKIHQGMGIGLALARQLAEAHGGTLSVQSIFPHGSLFVLHLPISINSA
ncbi:MAG: ATP-binding protein [Caldilineaceae bacterium]